jgi:hypothetical protein
MHSNIALYSIIMHFLVERTDALGGRKQELQKFNALNSDFKQHVFEVSVIFRSLFILRITKKGLPCPGEKYASSHFSITSELLPTEDFKWDWDSLESNVPLRRLLQKMQDFKLGENN